MRWTGFALLVTAFVMGFFHRMAPAVVAPDLQADFAVDATRLGLLAASYYYLYTLMQPISGLAADALGPRLAVGLLGMVGGVGSIVFGLADSFAMASLGRLLVGFGTAFLFVGLMKYNSLWFAPSVYGRVAGLTILIGNLGAVLAAGPLAWVLGFADWRDIFVGLGVAGIVLSMVIIASVRVPEDYAHTRPDIGKVLKISGVRWGTLAMFCTVGNVFAFSGLWSLPLLQDRFGLSRAAASDHVTVLMLALSAGALSAGYLSDRLGRRRLVAQLGAAAIFAAYAGLVLLPWAPGWSAMSLFILLGLGGGWVSVIYANAKELAGGSSAGFAMSVVNTGLFLGAALVQSGFGWVLDWIDPTAAGRDYSLLAWQSGLGLCLGIAMIGAVACWRLTDSGTRLVAPSATPSFATRTERT